MSEESPTSGVQTTVLRKVTDVKEWKKTIKIHKEKFKNLESEKERKRKKFYQWINIRIS
jgi:hypothetical protein